MSDTYAHEMQLLATKQAAADAEREYWELKLQWLKACVSDSRFNEKIP